MKCSSRSPCMTSSPVNDPICNFRSRTPRSRFVQSCSKFENTKRSNQRTQHNVIADVKIHQERAFGNRNLSPGTFISPVISVSIEIQHSIVGNVPCFSTQLMVRSFDVKTVSYGLNNPCTTPFILATQSNGRVLGNIFRNKRRRCDDLQRCVLP